MIPLDRPETLRWSSAGRVPVLCRGSLTVWESLAICEYAAELAPGAGLWPTDPAARAVARAVSCEMHAGFAELRRHMWMDLKHERPGEGRMLQVMADIDRITQLWRDVRAQFGAGGQFLFGHFTIADAMFAPVCTRFRTYAVEMPEDARAYMEAVLALPAMREWYDAAARETWVLGPH